MRGEGEAMGFSRFKRTAAELEYENSPIATPVRLPTIDALCGASSKKRLSGVSPHRTTISPVFSRGAPPSNSPVTRPTETLHPEAARPPSRTSSMEEDDEEQPVVANSVASEPSQPTKKRQRYLRDVDRRSIISRIEKGEKQAALAREFGVTRAAICHIKKNRDEIVSRYESLLQSAKEMEHAGITEAPRDAADRLGSVQELTRPSVLLLLTTLRDVATSRRAFRAAANRLMMILLEEALASVATVACDLRTTNGQTVRGVRAGRRTCCVAVGAKGMPLVRLHHEIDPTAGVGCIQMTTESRGEPVVGRVELPREVGSSRDVPTLLVTCSTASGRSVCAAIDALLDAGVAEESIRVVALVCTTRAIDTITSQFPGVRVLTCAVEATSDDSAAPSTTLSDFLARYSHVVKAEPAQDDEAFRRHGRLYRPPNWERRDDEAPRRYHATRDSR